MSLFRQHSKQNEEFSKNAMYNVAKRVIGKHTIAQEMLNQILSGGQTKGDGPCLECKIDKLTKVMAKLDNQYGEISKTYELIFGEPMDTSAIIEKSLNEFYPLATSGSGKSSRREEISNMFRSMFGGEDMTNTDETETGDPVINGITVEGMPADAPQDVKEIMNVITGALSKLGKNKKDFKVGVIDISKNSTHGLRFEDFKNADEFREAVIEARKNSKKSGEEIIKENVIANTEAFVASASSEEKPKRGPKGPRTPKDPKMN